MIFPLKKNMLLLFLFLGISLELTGQSQLIRRDTLRLPFSISQNNRQLLAISFDENKLQRSTNKVRLLQLDSFSLEDGDLNFQYLMKRLKKRFGYRLEFKVLSEAGTPFFFRDHKTEGIQINITRDMERHQQSRWKDVTEGPLYYGQTYQLEIVNELYGEGLDCGEKPEIKFRDQWPYWLGGLIGAGLLVAGEVYKNDAESIYEDYEKAWRVGSPKADGVELYSQFENKKRNHEGFTIAGIIVLGVDGLLYFLRLNQHWKQVRLFNSYCKIEPEISCGFISEDAAALNGLALRMTINF